LCEHFSDLLNTWLGLAWKHQEGCPEKSHQQNCFSANSLSGGYPDPALQFLHNPSRNGLKCSKKKPEMVELGTLILQFLHNPSRNGLDCSKKKSDMEELHLPNVAQQYLWLLLHSKMDSLYNTDLHSR
jgi:hypothetical protein